MQQLQNAPLVELLQPAQRDPASHLGVYSLLTNEDELNFHIDAARKAGIAAWDTETNGTFDRELIEIVGYSFAYGAKAFYVPINHWEGDQLLSDQALPPLKRLLEDSNVEKVMHNAKFDERLVSKYDIDCQGFGHDTFIMAWCLNEERGTRGLKPLNEKYHGIKMTTYEEVIENDPERKRNQKVDYNFAKVPLDKALDYAASDAYYTLKLYYTFKRIMKEQGLWDSYYNIEGPVGRVVRKMEDRGVSIDKELLAHADKRLPEIFEEVEATIYEEAGEVFEIGSRKQLGIVLYEKLGIGDGKAPKTATGQYKTDADTLGLYSTKHKIIPALQRRAKIQKLHSTFVEGAKENLTADGRIHPTFQPTGTVTGRFSCINPNLQQIPTEETEEVKIRDLYIPSPGYRFVVSDYSQVELRIMAHLARDEFMIDAFLSGADFHQQTADKMSVIMNREIERKHAKPLNFGIGYGRTEYSIAPALGCSMKEAVQFIEAWFATFPQVREYKDYVIARAHKEKLVRTMTNRMRLLPNLDARQRFVRVKAERQAFNTKIQGSAADIIKMAMISLAPELKKMEAHMVLTIHDELVIEALKDRSEDVLHVVKSIMEKPFRGTNPLRLPLVAEPKIVDKWGDAKD